MPYRMNTGPRRIGLAISTAAVMLTLLTACGSEPPPTAEQVVAEITATVPTAQIAQTITAENDPNKLLGRPGGYTSAVSFTDSRIPADQRNPDLTSIDNGGKVETFDTAEQAQQRADFINAIGREAPILGEYNYVTGTSLVRLSRTLTPAQAQEYEAAVVE